MVLDNADRRLRDKTFGTARIILREEPPAVVVPREAVQTTSDASFVFVRDKNYLQEGSPKVFHVRQVRIGAATLESPMANSSWSYANPCLDRMRTSS